MNFPSSTLSSSLVVRVEEPLLAYSPDATSGPVEDLGFTDALCSADETDPGEYRDPVNIRFRVYAELRLPLWEVKIPYMDTISVTLKDRAVGYIQCPRWEGKRSATDPDPSRRIGSEGPYLPFRNKATPGYPTVTTEPPTSTPEPATPTTTPP